MTGHLNRDDQEIGQRLAIMADFTIVRAARGPKLNRHALRALRLETGLTQVGLSRRSGVDDTYISRLEAGRRCWPAIRITEALATALDVPTEALLAADLNGGHS
jgi:DNA-binding XRE family transcriptional regulator